MSGAGDALQQAARAALGGIDGLCGVYPGPPLQAAAPYAVVEAGAESDWGHKTGEGREVRLSVTLYDEGERPGRVQALAAAAEAAILEINAVEGWELVTLRFLGSRLARSRSGSWSAAIDYRARLLVA
jgi:hypothetical protein